MIGCNLNREQKESLTAFLLGDLPAKEMQDIEHHLALGCSSCEQEIRELQEAMALLAHSVPPVAPSLSVKERLMERIATQPAQVVPLKSNKTVAKPWLSRSMKLLGRIAASFIILMLLATETVYLLEYKKQTRQQEDLIVGLKAQISKKENIITSMGTSRKLIVLDGNLVKANGRAFWDTNQNTWLFYIEKLPPAPAGKTYQLWFITENSAISGGIFKTNEHGCAELPLALPIETKPVGAAISLEPEGGSQQPRGAIYLSGSV